MKRRLTKIDAAEFLGCHPVTIGALEAQGMPAEFPALPAPNGDDKSESESRWTASRRELAALWNVHPDTLSRWLAEGLRAAVVERRGKNEPIFDVRIALRWKLARDGELNALVLEDFLACVQGDITAVHVLSPLYSFMREPEPEVPKRRKK